LNYSGVVFLISKYFFKRSNLLEVVALRDLFNFNLMYLIAVSCSLSNTRISIRLKKNVSLSSSSYCSAFTRFFKILASLSTPNVIIKELTRSKFSPFNSKLSSLDMNVVDYLTYLTISGFMRFFFETNN